MHSHRDTPSSAPGAADANGSPDDTVTGGNAVQAELAAYTYSVSYRRRANAPLPTSTVIGAYSEDDARARILDELTFYPEAEIVEIRQLDGPTPVTCTWNGDDGEGTSATDGPWQFLPPVGPVLVCDVHGLVAWPEVYTSATSDDGGYGPERYHGPCRFFP